MTERLIKILVLIMAIACALCFSEILIAATSTGSLAISAIVLSRCAIRFSIGGVAPQSTCDAGMKGVVTIEPPIQKADPRPPTGNAGPAEAGSVITITY